MSAIPAAYALAKSTRENLARRFGRLRQDLDRRNCTIHLTGFLSILDCRRCSINMSLESCIRLLKSGRLLNRHESIALNTGLTGKQLEDAVRKSIPAWGKQRQVFERLLKFGQNTHYTAMNLGGAGATRYGICCVIFDINQLGDYLTCFGGDSLRAAFNSNGKRLLNKAEILSWFTVETDLSSMAALKHHEYIARQ